MPFLTLTNNQRILETQSFIMIPALALNQRYSGLTHNTVEEFLLMNTKNASVSSTKDNPLGGGVGGGGGKKVKTPELHLPGISWLRLLNASII